MLKKIFKYLIHSSLAEKMIVFKDVFLTQENENIARAIKLLKSSDKTNEAMIVDVGAFHGHTAQLFAKAFPSKSILAFEAHPGSYEKARERAQALPNMEVHNYAISNKNETMTFYITSNKVSSSLNNIDVLGVNSGDYKKELDVTEKVEVQARKLDEFTNNKHIALLKIDTQGHELEVLEGATETLKNTRFVLIEMSNHHIYEHGCKYYEVDEWMRQHNFDLVDLIVTYRQKGLRISEYDAIYENLALSEKK